jgi:hypothetical protein
MRGQRVLLDTELADFYGVTTKRFNEQVRRNRERFPADFIFQPPPKRPRLWRFSGDPGSGYIQCQTTPAAG